MKKTYLIMLLLSGCYSSSGGDYNGGQDADDAVDRIEHETMPDVQPDPAADPIPDPPPDGVECTMNEHCAVALYQDRCCEPDPVAVSRQQALADPCLHVLGEPWVDNEDCPEIDCLRCMEISERAYEAACLDGECVLVRDYCPPMAMPEPVISAKAGDTPEGGWERFRGRVVRVWGETYLGPDSCECCFECGCTCFEETVQLTLDCAISVRGSICGESWECTGTECESSCSSGYVMGPVTATGYLVDSEEDGLELWVMEVDDEDCPPPGPNPEDAPCTPFSDNSECEEDLFCYYWGDVVWPCAGTCRPFGDECDIDEDCGDERVCYNGYCEWCCPG